MVNSSRSAAIASLLPSPFSIKPFFLSFPTATPSSTFPQGLYRRDEANGELLAVIDFCCFNDFVTNKLMKTLKNCLLYTWREQKFVPRSPFLLRKTAN
ncbi:unnamed protein product, partial [Linum tenue]